MESAIDTRRPYTVLTMSERSPSTDREIGTQAPSGCHDAIAMQTEVCVRVFAQDQELRAWLVDELALLSPTLEVGTVDALDGASAQLLIVGLDGLSLADAQRVRELATTTSVIAIGSPTSQLAAAPFVCVLDTKLTSKDLKRAVRESLSARPTHVA
jgi:hypothetical protein